MADTLAPGEVLPLLRGRFGEPYRYAEVCPSTQRLFAAGDPEGAVAAAEEQTEGRGRLGRIWLAPPATSILASIVLVPQIAPERLPELSLVAGDAVARAIASETGAEPRVRFPNDVLIEGRKVAGILAEASDGRVVVGIGVNANQREDDLPVSAETAPTSLLLATGSRVDRARLLATLLVELERAYDAWLSERGESG
ncbi:MAG: biotin--[acetyl-CoA-carboxylase] ligase [Actinobacteria bacterium]|nr:MAG: biotin--[acetyl-CoA-carboxylase] ligase [Actinomycetota bacterium]